MEAEVEERLLKEMNYYDYDYFVSSLHDADYDCCCCCFLEKDYHVVDDVRHLFLDDYCCAVVVSWQLMKLLQVVVVAVFSACVLAKKSLIYSYFRSLLLLRDVSLLSLKWRRFLEE